MNKSRPVCLKFISIFILPLIFLGYSCQHIHAFEEIDSLREYLFGVDQEKSKLTSFPKFIKVIRGDYERIYITNASNPQDALKQNGYIVSNDSKIFAYSNDHLSGLSSVKIIRLKTEVEVRDIQIAFSTRVFESWQYPLGEEITVQEGIPGVLEQRVQFFYEDGELIKEDIQSETILREPTEEVIAVGSSTYTLEGIIQRGYDCNFWYSVVDNGSYSAKEKEWLKFVMYCESGCNAESNKGFYKGLFQWSPTLWKKLYSENIFDGYAQIQHTVEKLRSGADPSKMWPACSKKYESKYGDF